MKRSLCWTALLELALLLNPAWSQQPDEAEKAFVYKADGTLHCGTTQGIPLDTMAQELIRNGIPVYTSRKAHDGREGIAVCGEPTGSINAYEIDASDLPEALHLGFRRIDPTWRKPRQTDD